MQIETWPLASGPEESCKSLNGTINVRVLTYGGSFSFKTSYGLFSYQRLRFDCSNLQVKNGNCTAILSSQIKSAILELSAVETDASIVVTVPITTIQTLNLDYMACWKNYQFTHTYDRLTEMSAVCLYATPNFCSFPEAATRTAKATIRIAFNNTETVIPIVPKINPPEGYTGFTIPYNHAQVKSYCYNCSSLSVIADKQACHAFVTALLSAEKIESTFVLSMDSIEDSNTVTIPISLSLSSYYITATQYRNCFLKAVLAIYKDRIGVTLTMDVSNQDCKQDSEYALGYSSLTVATDTGSVLFLQGHEVEDFDFVPSYSSWFVCSNQTCINSLSDLIPLINNLTSSLTLRMYNQFKDLINTVTIPITDYVIMCWSAINFYIGTADIKLELELTTHGNCDQIQQQIDSLPSDQTIPMKITLYSNKYSSMEQRRLTEIATFQRKMHKFKLSEPQIMTCDNWIHKGQGSSCLADLTTARRLISSNKLVVIGFIGKSEILATNYYKDDHMGVYVAIGILLGAALIIGVTLSVMLSRKFKRCPIPVDVEMKLRQERREKRKQKRLEKKQQAQKSI